MGSPVSIPRFPRVWIACAKRAVWGHWAGSRRCLSHLPLAFGLSAPSSSSTPSAYFPPSFSSATLASPSRNLGGTLMTLADVVLLLQSSFSSTSRPPRHSSPIILPFLIVSSNIASTCRGSTRPYHIPMPARGDFSPPSTAKSGGMYTITFPAKA